MTAILRFPPGFLWGTASSAYQVEGGNFNNQWAEFEQQPGAIWHGDHCGLACNWWQAAEDDFDRMADHRLNAHRLSIEWSRVEPTPGVYDRTALDRYRAMLAGLQARGIRPFVALHHFTNPLWFQRAGGWEHPGSPSRFHAYVRTVVDALSDLCRDWLTMNEPLVHLGQGWVRGAWPPHRRNPALAVRVFRHLLLAHGAAYGAIHLRQPDAQVGYAAAMRGFAPLRPQHPLDRLSARLKRYLYEEIWLAATTDGRIRPPAGLRDYNPCLHDSLDFLGFNYYARQFVRFTPNPLAQFGRERFPPGAEFSDSGRHGPYSALQPAGLADLCLDLRRFGKPLYVLENGLPDADDDQRPRWLLAHLVHLHRAIQKGCDVRGYFHWTFVDNFEWTDGWGLRFGLYGLDPASQVRQARGSAAVYGSIARHNGILATTLHEHAPDFVRSQFQSVA